MSSISGTLPNLIGGVSQQPAATRLENTAEDLRNAVCSVVTGMRKRPGFELVKQLPGLDVADVGEEVEFFLWERPAEGSRILVTTPDGTLRVFQLDGTEDTVNAAGNAVSYLSSGGSEGRLGYCPVGDAVYIYNRDVEVDNVIATPPEGPAPIVRNTSTVTITTPLSEGVQILRGGSVVAETSSTDLSIAASELSEALEDADIAFEFTGTSFVITHPPAQEYTVDGDATITTTSDTFNPDALTTIVIENPAAGTNYRILKNGNVVANRDIGDNARDVGNIARSLSAQLGSQPHVLKNNVLVIDTEEGDVWTSEPGSLTRTYVDRIQQFTSLPPDEVENRIVAVSPSPDEEADAYYVRYRDRVWSETRGPALLSTVDPTTMPVILRQTGPTTWVLGTESWESPTVGDPDTNPLPSFVGFPVSHMFLFRDRMAILADENIVFSQVGNYRNFFRTTVSLIRDDDRLDGAVTVPGESVVNLSSALAFDGNLYLFSDRSQILLEFNDVSPGQFRAVPLSNFEVSREAPPALVGDRALFADAGGEGTGWARVREYRLEAVTGTNQAEDITRQVPRFIPAGVYSFATSPATDSVHVLSRAEPDALFRYDYYNTSEGRVQSAWNKWHVPGFVFEGAAVASRSLYVLLKGNGRRYLAFAGIEDTFERDVGDRTANLDLRVETDTLRFEEASPDTTAEREAVFPDGMRPKVYTWNGLVIVIPERIGLYGSKEWPPYTAWDNFPYWTDEPIWAVEKETGEPHPGHVIGNPGDPSSWTAVFPDVDLRETGAFVGMPVKFTYKLSPIYIRDSQQTAIHDGRLQLRYLSIMFNDTVAFKVNVKSPGYTEANLPVLGVEGRVNTSDGFLRRGTLGFPGPSTVRFGKFRVPVATRGEHLDVTITDDGPFQCAFSSIEWEGSWRPRTNRMNR